MSDETRLKRLRYRSWHRGCKETDLILGSFSDAELPGLSSAELDLYEKLLDENDADIWAWLTGKSSAGEYASLIELLKPYGVTA